MTYIDNRGVPTHKNHLILSEKVKIIILIILNIKTSLHSSLKSTGIHIKLYLFTPTSS